MSTFRFAGGDGPESESAKILQELRAEAAAYGFWLELDVWPDGIPLCRQRGSPQNLPIDKAFPPKRASEISTSFSKHYWRLCDALNAERRARGQKPIQ